MKTIVLACLTIGTLSGCERKEPPMEMIIPPPVMAQAPAVITPDSPVQMTQEDEMVIRPNSVENEEIIQTQFPELFEPQPPNAAPLETIKSPAVTSAPLQDYNQKNQNSVNENNAVNNSDPAVFVSPYAQ